MPLHFIRTALVSVKNWIDSESPAADFLELPVALWHDEFKLGCLGRERFEHESESQHLIGKWDNGSHGIEGDVVHADQFKLATLIALDISIRFDVENVNYFEVAKVNFKSKNR